MQERFFFTDESATHFRIDERTKVLGRKNIAAARASLAALNATDMNEHTAHAA